MASQNYEWVDDPVIAKTPGKVGTAMQYGKRLLWFNLGSKEVPENKHRRRLISARVWRDSFNEKPTGCKRGIPGYDHCRTPARRENLLGPTAGTVEQSIPLRPRCEVRHSISLCNIIACMLYSFI